MLAGKPQVKLTSGRHRVRHNRISRVAARLLTQLEVLADSIELS